MNKNVEKPQEVETTGHNWDGITELDTPMPRWWLWTFYACIVWGIGYVIAYPAWPLLKEATPGVLGYSSRANVAAEIERVNAANASLDQLLVATSLEDLQGNQDLNRYAVSGGGAVFRTNCIQCHGAGAQGFKGYPNLLDDDWLWGGDITAIYDTVSHGIRAETDDDTRYSEMPKFGEFLEPEEIENVAHYVRGLSGQEFSQDKSVLGAEIFADNCSACHGEDGTGDREQGAPNLTDAIWLYGGDLDTVTTTIKGSRFGVMPNWSARLTEAQVRQVAAYVHQLGGGE